MRDFNHTENVVSNFGIHVVLRMKRSPPSYFSNREPHHVPISSPESNLQISISFRHARLTALRRVCTAQSRRETMAPSLGTLVWSSAVVVLAAVLYQIGLPDTFVTKVIVQVIRGFTQDTRCYISVKTFSARLPHAECFTVSKGRFTRVFLDETSYDVVKAARKGHVIPGLWDGHGHLMQYGELLDSVNLFGARDMEEVRKRLVEYKGSREESGSKEQWLRGVGWDQANFEGEWPVAVGDSFRPF